MQWRPVEQHVLKASYQELDFCGSKTMNTFCGLNPGLTRRTVHRTINSWQRTFSRFRYYRQLLALTVFTLLLWMYRVGRPQALDDENELAGRLQPRLPGLLAKALSAGSTQRRHQSYSRWPPALRPNLTLGNELFLDDVTRNERRREAVRRAMQHAWRGYRQYAWDHDELRPLSHSYEDSMNGVGLTLIDALDTLYLMGLHDEFRDARAWLARSEHRFARPKAEPVSIFEMNIRLLGGLLSTYQLSGDPLFLQKAEELGHLFAHAFLGRPPPRMPHPSCRFRVRSQRTGSDDENGTIVTCRAAERVVLSECGTLQLEFRALGAATRDPLLKGLAERADQVLRDIIARAPLDGLPNNILSSADGSSFVNKSAEIVRFVNLGAAGDSYYEYILKSYIQLGRTDPFWRRESDRIIDALERIVFRRGVLIETLESPSDPARQTERQHQLKQPLKRFVNVSWPVVLSNSEEIHQPDHLSCFASSLFVLAVPPEQWDASVRNDRAERLLRLAGEHARFCFEMYLVNAGLSSESVEVQPSSPQDSPYADRPLVQIRSYVRGYHQRPETLEALFYLWRATHDPKYRDWGWTIFQAMEWYTRVPSGGYVGCRDPDNGCRIPIDKMESFLLAETLKYAYLLFSDDAALDIKNEWVFNTEAHPLRIMSVSRER
jgi:hypothetical protein